MGGHMRVVKLQLASKAKSVARGLVPRRFGASRGRLPGIWPTTSGARGQALALRCWPPPFVGGFGSRDISWRSVVSLAVSAIAMVALVGPVLAQEGPERAAASVSYAQSGEGPAAGSSPGWVAAHAPTDLWSERGRNAARLEPVPPGAWLQVLAPQEDSRLFVRNPVTAAVGWVDAVAVGPIPRPSDEQLGALAAAPAFEPWWAMTHMPAVRWPQAGEEAEAQESIPQWRYLQVLKPEEDGRVLTVDPRTGAHGYVDVAALGPVGPPTVDYFSAPPADDETLRLPGRIVGRTDSYERPSAENYFSLNGLAHNQPVTVQGVVNGDNGARWYRVGSAEYVPEARVRVPSLPDRTWPERWIDANLSEPAMVTAYEGDQPVYAALAVKGAVAYQTPTGVYRIGRRVEREIMDSATIGIPRSSPNGYYLKDVLYTQYFTNDGAALHYNYWRSDWGYGGSKGCLGMNLEDSRFFWEFASTGTVVYVRF